MNGPRMAGLPLVIVRVAVAALLAVHGWARALGGGVSPLASFLATQRVPGSVALALAWAITLFEMVGPVLLALGRSVRWVALGHAAILAGGIALVHAKEGWFVVGAGRNGVEYSVLLLACLAALFLAGSPRGGAVRRTTLS